MARTLFHLPNALATSVHAAGNEHAMDVTPPAGSTDIAISGIGTSGELVLVFSSVGTQPDNVAWPNGVYQTLLDVPSMDSTTAFGFTTLGSGVGHFARVNATLDADIETHQQAEAVFTSPGLKSATYTGAWADGAQADRFEALLAAQKIFGHGNDQITVRMDSDGRSEGPWAGGASEPTGVFSGASEITQLESDVAEVTTVQASMSEII